MLEEERRRLKNGSELLLGSQQAVTLLVSLAGAVAPEFSAGGSLQFGVEASVSGVRGGV